MVLPAQPAREDYAAYLALMGLMGNVTGYPAHAVTVVTQGQVLDTVADKDLLVIASSAQSPLLRAVGRPPTLQPQRPNQRNAGVWTTLPGCCAGGHPDQRDRARPGQTALTFTSASVDAVIAGFESPLKNGRSVVLLASNQAAGLKQAVQALLTPELLQHIQGSTAVVHGKQVDSLVAEQTYYVGHLGPVTWARWWLSRSPDGTYFFGGSCGLVDCIYVVCGFACPCPYPAQSGGLTGGEQPLARTTAVELLSSDNPLTSEQAAFTGPASNSDICMPVHRTTIFMGTLCAAIAPAMTAIGCNAPASEGGPSLERSTPNPGATCLGSPHQCPRQASTGAVPNLL